jgi:hypothetical protein
LDKPFNEVRLVEEEQYVEPGLAVEADESGGQVKTVRDDRPTLAFLCNHVVVFDTGTESVAESVETGASAFSELEPVGPHEPVEKETNDQRTASDELESRETVESGRNDPAESVEIGPNDPTNEIADPIETESTQKAQETARG